MCKKIVFLFIIFANCIYATAQETTESGFVEYIESANNLQIRQTSVIHKNLGKETESEEGYLVSRRGCFEVTYDDNYFMTEGVKHCLKLALDNWEDKISINKPVKFHVCISEGLPSEIAILTHVSYYKVRKYCLPTNLFKQNNTIKEETCDTIQINALIDWNSSWTYDDTYYGSVSLLSGFMRSIAHIMGFGTTLHNRQDRIGFAINRTPSTFDQMIYNGEKYLSDLYTTSNKSVFDSFFEKGTRLQSTSFDYNLFKFRKLS